MPASLSLVGYTESTPIDGKTLGQTKIQPAVSTNYIPLLVSLETVSISGVVTLPLVSVGTNSPNYNNIMTLTTLPSAASVITVPVVAGQIFNNQDVYVNVGVAGVGTGSITFRASLISAV